MNLRIGTHNGKFHADEVLAVAILKQLYPDAELIRSRAKDWLGQCDLVVDVGGGQYDHHTTDKVFRENGIPYASAGLIWRDFGARVIQEWDESVEVGTVVTTIDEKVIQGVDANDNGFHLEKDPRIKGISDLIAGFNPPWNTNDDENEAFHRAVAFATTILTNQIRSELSRLQAVSVVEEAFRHRAQKELLVLETVCPWTETLIGLDEAQEVLYVVFPDRSGGYRLQVVPDGSGTFEARKPLPAEWAGKEGDELGNIVGINDAVFCHPARFIAGAKSRDSIMKMARLAVEDKQ